MTTANHACEKIEEDAMENEQLMNMGTEEKEKVTSARLGRMEYDLLQSAAGLRYLAQTIRELISEKPEKIVEGLPGIGGIVASLADSVQKIVDELEACYDAL